MIASFAELRGITHIPPRQNEWHDVTKKDNLIPLKQVAGVLGVSRSTLWRARKGGGDDFPPPLVRQGRVYWRHADLPALREALSRYQGRIAFEIEQRHVKVRAARADAAVRGGRMRAAQRNMSDLRQADLFG